MSRQHIRVMHASTAMHRNTHNRSNTFVNSHRHEPQHTRKSISFDHNKNKVCFVNVPPRSQNKHYWFTESSHITRKGFSFQVQPNIAVELSVDCRIQLTTIAQRSELTTSSSSPLTLQTSSLAVSKSNRKCTANLIAQSRSQQLNTSSRTKQPQTDNHKRCYVQIRESFSLFDNMVGAFDYNDEDDDDDVNGGACVTNSKNFLKNSNKNNSTYRNNNTCWYCLGSVQPNTMQKINITLSAGIYQIRVIGTHSVQLFAQAWEVERALS